MNRKVLISILIFALLASCLMLAACSQDTVTEEQLREQGYYKVTYNVMGGTIDHLGERYVFVKHGKLLPKTDGIASGQGNHLAEPFKEGYYLDGWYVGVDPNSASYFADEKGAYVYYYTFEESETGSWVEYNYYYESSDGKYVAKKGLEFATDPTDISYELFVEKEENPETGKEEPVVYSEDEYICVNGKVERYDMVVRYEEYDEGNPAHASLKRCNATPAYVLADENNPDHSSLQRFDITMDFDADGVKKWDFDHDVMPENDVTLYARWVKRLTVVFDYCNGGTSIVYENGLSGITITAGQPIPKTSAIPTKQGYTFYCWEYTDGTGVTKPWDFANDVFPLDETTITLKASYVEGTYDALLSTVEDLKKVGQKPSGSYYLLNDIDCGGATGNPFGLSGSTSAIKFSGTFEGAGHTISNFTIDVINGTSRKIDPPYESGAIFAKIDGATISNLNVNYTIVVRDKSVGPVRIGGIAGEAYGNSTVNNCNVTVTMSAGMTPSQIYYGARIGYYADGATVTFTGGSVHNIYNFGLATATETVEK